MTSASRLSTGWTADSTPSTSTLSPAGAAPDSPASPGSSRRQLAGYTAACEIDRTAAMAAVTSPNLTDADALNRGRSCSRIHASVITPRVPSEPRNIRSGDGPAPEPGSRHDSLIPAGVTTRSDSTRSSMWVCSVA
jgi:hypothetical protein